MQESLTGDGDTNSPMDPIRDLFRKIFQHNERLRKYQTNLSTPKSYMLLVQHSLRTELRLQQFSQTSTTNTSDEQVYRHAGLLTPWEMASKDLQAGDLWMKHITEQLIQSCPAQSTILLCATTPNSQSWIHEIKRGGRYNNVVILDSLVDDPWGWDSADNTTNQNLNSLDNMLELIIEKEKTESTSLGGLVLESLTPLLQRHGMTRVQSFLSKLSYLSSDNESPTATIPILVLPILTEMASPAQHRQLEDMTESVLCLEGGQATWLRQGVRERGNLVRQTLDYDIVEPNKDRPKRIHIIHSIEGGSSDNAAASKDTNKKNDDTDAATSAIQSMSLSESVPGSSQTTSTTPTDHNHSHSHSHSHPSTTTERKGRSKKMQLAYSDEGRQEAPLAPPEAPIPAPAPRIFMEENDPEFEDYDEEDPDDDLDI